MSDSPRVLVLMGSRNDWETMQHTVLTLKELGVPCEAHVASAHRTPDKVADLCKGAETRGIRVVIAAAGNSAKERRSAASSTASSRHRAAVHHRNGFPMATTP